MKPALVGKENEEGRAVEAQPIRRHTSRRGQTSGTWGRGGKTRDSPGEIEKYCRALQSDYGPNG